MLYQDPDNICFTRVPDEVDDLTFARIKEMSDEGEKKDKKLKKGIPVLNKS